MQIMRNRRRRKVPALAKSLFLVVLLGGASFGIAFLWQNMQERAQSSETVATAEDAGLQTERETQVSSGPAVEQAASQPAQLEEEPDESARPAPVPGAVAASRAVDNSYFRDAIFFGDSISTGIPLYKVAGNPDTVAWSGINPDTINTSAVIATDEGMLTMLEAARQYGDKSKVYIMLGANSLWMDDSTFVNGYQQFIDGVKGQYPGATVYLQSILPVTADAQPEQEHVNNENIRHFNELIQGLATRNGVHYLDVAQAVMDNTGALPDEASPVDGMHLSPEYYYMWFEYLKTHTVEAGRR